MACHTLPTCAYSPQIQAQASKYTIRYPYGGKTLEMSLAAVDSGDNSGDGSGQTDTSSSGLSTITVVAISVGAGIALTAIIVMLIVLVKVSSTECKLAFSSCL